MNAITGPSQSLAIGALFTNAPVGRVRRIPTADERTTAQAADTWEPSADREALPQVTYSRSGTGAAARSGGG
jgi:hypothetical protein